MKTKYSTQSCESEVDTKNKQNESIDALLELKQRRQWVVYRSEDRGGRISKVPFQTNGRKASTTKPTTWTTYEVVCEAVQEKHFDGIGFVFTANDPFAGIDLDNCIDKEGNVADYAKKIIFALESYSEYSPSGNGVHIILKGQVPKGGINRKHGIDGLYPIEIYDRGRFFTVTENQFHDTVSEVNERQGQLERLYSSVTASRKLNDDGLSTGGSTSSLSDEEVISLAKQAKNSDKFISLFEKEKYPKSHSEAVQSLLCLLVFYTQDHAQIDRLYKRSALFSGEWKEKKWERRKNQEIERAIVLNSERYNPVRRVTSNDFPQPLNPQLPKVEKFDPEILPSPLSEYAMDVAHRMQCPIDYVVAALVVAAGSVVGNSLLIRPKRKDNWQLPLNLWGAVVGDPGSFKTPAIAKAKKFIEVLESEAWEGFCEINKEWEQKIEIAKTKHRTWLGRIAKLENEIEEKEFELKNG